MIAVINLVQGGRIMGKKGLNIYCRKDGRWEGRYKDGSREDGKAKYRSVYTLTYSAVREKLLKVYAAIEQPVSICAKTVKQLFLEWVEMKRLTVKESTIENYVFKANKHLFAAFGNMKFSEISVSLVCKFIQDKLNGGLSAKYVSDMVVILKSMAKYAAKTYNCKNPICDLKLPKTEKTELKLYSKEQQNSLKSTLLLKMNLTKLGILL